MSTWQFLIIVLVMALSVQITRWLPFLIFRNAQKLPRVIEYLGNVLPAAMMGLLVIYCFKDLDFLSYASWLPAFLASLVTAGLQLWRRNMILSIAVGTALYMILIRVIH